MDVQSYFESVGLELRALKQRVRQLIAGAQWQTDGEWKESVVRQVLRRHLPATAVVGRGFVVTSDSATTQLDVLIHDGSKPVLFKDGDLAFVTPDAVLGIIEVKSRIGPAELGVAAERLARNIELIRLHPNSDAFSGVFAFEADGNNSQTYLERLAAAAVNWNQRLDFAAIGESLFLKYWHLDPETARQMYQHWRAYRMPGLAPGYFIHNVVDAVCPDSVEPNTEVWFPTAGKEQYRDGSIASQWI
jgi:hypothetical protein